MAITDRLPLGLIPISFQEDNLTSALYKCDPDLTPRTLGMAEELQKENIKRGVFGECSRDLQHDPEYGTVIFANQALPPKFGTFTNIREGILIAEGQIHKIALASPRTKDQTRFQQLSYFAEKNHLEKIGAEHLLTERTTFKANGKERYFEPYYPDGTLSDFKMKYQADEDYPKRVLKRFLLVAKDLKERFHDFDLIHRDIKPSNIILNGEEARLIDYNCVIQAPSEIKVKRTSGTMQYLAPECFARRYSKASDIFALGTTLENTLDKTPQKFKLKNASKICNFFIRMRGRVQNRLTIEQVISNAEELIAELESPPLEK